MCVRPFRDLFVCLVACLFVEVIGRFVDRLIAWSFACFSIVRMLVCVACSFVLFVCLFRLFAGLLVSLVGWLVGWFVGWLVRLFVCLRVCVFD